MSEKIIVPTLGESVTEATVAKWLKNAGDKVLSDEPLVELETDKVNVEVPSPTDGILENIKVKEGETVNVGALLGSVSQAKVSKEKNKNEKQYTPPKLEKIPNPVQEKKIKKKEVEPLILNQDTEQKIFDEEPLVLDTIHNEPVQNISENIKKKELRV